MPLSDKQHKLLAAMRADLAIVKAATGWTPERNAAADRLTAVPTEDMLYIIDALQVENEKLRDAMHRAISLGLSGEGMYEITAIVGWEGK